MDKRFKHKSETDVALPTTRKPRPLSFTDNPTDVEISVARVFTHPLVPMLSTPVPGENSALAQALLAFKEKADPEDVTDLTGFISSMPDSRWRASLEFFLGQMRLDRGYFSEALSYWTASWERSKSETGAKQKSVADEAVSRLMSLYGRLGEQGEVRKYLDEIKGRALFGSIDTRVAGVRTQLTHMEQRPETAFKCGPCGLLVLAADLPREKVLEVFGKADSTRQGTNLAQLKEWAKEIGLDYVAAKRDSGAQFIVPSLVHWRVAHFAAITARDGDTFTIDDPTFGSSRKFKISAKALEAETDGFFLVPAGSLPTGWREITKEEAANVWGKGVSPSRNQNQKTPACPKTSSCPVGPGMAAAGAFSMQGSLNIVDTPLSYQPPISAAIEFRANYNYQEAGQPAPGLFTFSNLGPNWSLNWISYAQGTAPGHGGGATVFVRGGGSEIYPETPYLHDIISQATLTCPDFESYQRSLPDGSSEIFATYDGTDNYFLTYVIDAQGNTSEITYDDTFRVQSVIDPFGQSSTFDYGSDTEGESSYYAITQITDPHGRTAQFEYDPTYTYLLSITDQIGMTSSFTYSESLVSFVSQMTTPYGTTTFEVYEPSDIAVGLKVTYPDNTISQIESWIGLVMETYYWDRWAMTLYPDDPADGVYTHCVTTHWIGENPTEIMSAVPLWVQPPLDYQIWYAYLGYYWNGYEIGHWWVSVLSNCKPTRVRPLNHVVA